MKKQLLIYVFLLLFFGLTKAQTEVYSVKKVYTKKIDILKENKLHVIGEKADILIQHHNGKDIELVVKFTAKNKSREVAEKDILIMRYEHIRVKRVISISNYYVLGKNQKEVTSSLHVEIILKIPQKLPLSVVNQFGTIELENLKQNILAESDFGKLKLKNCKGEINAKCKFTELTASDCNNIIVIGKNNDIQLLNHGPKISFSLENSDVFIQPQSEISGELKLINGSVKIIGLNQELQSVSIQTQKSEVFISNTYKTKRTEDKTTIESPSQLILNISISFGKIQII